MADHVVPHFHNDAGVPVIEIGSQEFMCVGANSPFDHPHVFLDLGNDNEIICPYCSTLYRFAPGLTAALALAHKGFRVVVLEKAERLEEAGAGLQLSPNASRILIDLGLKERLRPRVVTPEAITIVSSRAGGELTRLPLGEGASQRAGAP